MAGVIHVPLSENGFGRLAGLSPAGLSQAACLESQNYENHASDVSQQAVEQCMAYNSEPRAQAAVLTDETRWW